MLAQNLTFTALDTSLSNHVPFIFIFSTHVMFSYHMQLISNYSIIQNIYKMLKINYTISIAIYLFIYLLRLYSTSAEGL